MIDMTKKYQNVNVLISTNRRSLFRHVNRRDLWSKSLEQVWVSCVRGKVYVKWWAAAEHLSCAFVRKSFKKKCFRCFREKCDREKICFSCKNVNVKYFRKVVHE